MDHGGDGGIAAPAATSSSVPKPRSRNLAWLWQALGLVLALFVVEQDIEYAMRTAGIQPGLGVMGMTSQLAPDTGPGWREVTAVAPEGPLSKAGVGVGDRIRFDRAQDAWRPLRAGEDVGVTILREGPERRAAIVAAPYAEVFPSRGDTLFNLLLGLSNAVPALVGAFIIWRSGGRGAALLLGLALVCYAKAVPGSELWVSTPETYPWLLGFGEGVTLLAGILFLAFPMRFYEETVGRLNRWHWIALFAAAALAGLSIIPANMSFYLTASTLPVVDNGLDLLGAVGVLTMIATLIVMVQGWRRAPPEAQKRYALLLTAFGAIMLVQGVYFLFRFLSADLLDSSNPFSWASMLVQGVLAPGLFAYAILRHKVFDLGFAINRTLVFGVVSAILLMAFGLSEWALDKLVTIESRETNALLDAGLALAVFLAFHHVQTAVEHVIERLFFRRWHEKETALKKFAKQAGFVLKGDALARAFVDELKRFCDGAEVALYLRNEAGSFVLSEGQLAGGPAVIGADDPLLVSMRSDRGAADLDETRSALPAALGLPMIHRVELTGFALLGDKPGGLGYRPDEKAILAATTLQVGLDLHALKVEQLEQRVVSLEARNGELHAVLAARSLPVQ